MSFSIFTETAAWAKNKKLNCSALAQIGSTNDLAKEEAFFLKEEFKLYVADQQSAGRGRGTNTWLNPVSGAALLSTWSFRIETSAQAITAPLVGLAVYEALQRSFVNAPLSIKPPNDIYLGDKKILGLLIETLKQGPAQRLIVGLGLNVFSHPAEIETADCLARVMSVDAHAWSHFLDNLYACLRVTAISVGESTLSESARADLLLAINKNPNLKTPYTSLSPFGDLASEAGVKSWRDL